MRFYYIPYLFASLAAGGLGGPGYCMAVAVLFLLHAFKRKEPRRTECLVTALLLILAGWSAGLRIRNSRKPPVSRYAYRILSLEGRVRYRRAGKEGRPGFVRLDVHRVELLNRRWIPVSGSAALYSREKLRQGTPVRFAGEAVPVADLESAGLRRYLARSGIAVMLTGAVLSKKISRSAPDAMRERIIERFRRPLQVLSPEAAGTLLALLCGDREGIPAQIRQQFRRSGLIHLLAVSGLHVGVVGGVVLFLCRRVRFGVRISAVCTVLVFYVLFTGSNPSTVRAALMLVLYLMLQRVRQSVLPLQVMAAAGCLMLLVEPDAVRQAGFQLSFAAVAGILVLSGRAAALPGLRRLPFVLRQGLAVSIAAQAGVLPLLLFHFGSASAAAVLLTMPALVPVTVLLIGGFLLVPLVWISGISRIPLLLQPAADLLLLLTAAGEALPLRLETGRGGFPVIAVLLYYLCGILVLQRRELFGRRNKSAGAAVPAQAAEISAR